MSTKKDGGPAFPGEEMDERILGKRNPVRGMSLRDYFAGQALAGYRAHPANEQLEHADQNVARYCYGIADAMLKAREQ